LREDLNYVFIKNMKKEKKGNFEDIYFEATIEAIPFPLVVDGDWNPKLFKLLKKEKEEFLKIPNERKLNFIVTMLMFFNKGYLDILEKSQEIFEKNYEKEIIKKVKKF